MKNNFIKKVAITSLVALASISVFTGCSKNENIGNQIAVEQDATGGNGQKINEKDSYDTAAKQVPAEYKQVTTNENGVKIYGKIVDANTASPTGKKVIEKKTIADKEFTADHYCVYSEYYSEAYGGTVILRTDNKTGGLEIYDKDGDCFASGKAVKDMDRWLANYRLGNALAGIADEAKKKNK